MRLLDGEVVLIDGRSGSGKTALTEQLVRAARGAGLGVQVLHVEDLYPGWDGLALGSRAVATVLDERRYRRYNWTTGGFGDWIELTEETPLVIEGCGAVTRENLAAARAWVERAWVERRARGGFGEGERGAAVTPRVRSIWLECPVDVRRTRALARDGERFRPHWERWAAQEDAYFALTRPDELADEVRRSA